MYAAQSTHLPFKINMSGVIPPIFASSILMFPATVAQFFGQSAEPGTVQTWLQTIGANLGPGQPIYVILYAALIIFFCFFYTAIQYNSKDTADNLKRSGAFVPGIRPGAQTAEYIDRVLTRLTFWGAIYIAGVCLLPEIFPHVLPECAVQLRRYLVVDSGRRNDGLHVAAAGARDEPSVRGHDAEGQSAQLRSQWHGPLVRDRLRRRR